MVKQRYYHRFIRDDDLKELEEASKYLFAFDPHEVSLKDVIGSDRWFCLAAVSATETGEKIVGFVAAALGAVSEFPQEKQYLQQALLAAQHNNSSSSSNQQLATQADPTSSSSSSSSGSSNAGSDTLALEVVLLGVVPDYRRRGVASRLLKQVRTHARTRGASLLFLHVQTTNTPARSLYEKSGFTQSAVLPDYYSFKQDLQQQQQQQQRYVDTATASMQSAWGLDEFSGTDAALLIMQIKQQQQLMGQVADTAAAVTGSSSSSSSRWSAGGSEYSSDLEEVLGAAAAGSGSGSSSDRMGYSSIAQQQWQQQQQDELAASSSSSRSDPAAPSAAAEAVTAAAAAAARLLFGPAIGLLGLSRVGRSNLPASKQQQGRRGELVVITDGEYMVQVRQGNDVLIYDPDELPNDVVFSNRDKRLLQIQRQRQRAMLSEVRQQQSLQQQQQQKVDNRSDDDPNDHSSSGGGGSGGGSVSQQQQQQQDQGVAVVSASGAQQSNSCRAMQQQQQQQQQWLAPHWDWPSHSSAQRSRHLRHARVLQHISQQLCTVRWLRNWGHTQQWHNSRAAMPVIAAATGVAASSRKGHSLMGGAAPHRHSYNLVQHGASRAVHWL